MSNDHNHKEQIPQRKLGTALRSFFDHVTSHDEEGVHAALCMVANAASAESDGEPTVGMHICNFGAGDPDALAQMVVVAIDTMIEEVPGFTKAWEDALRAKRLQSMISQVLGVVQQAKEQAAEAKGMEAAKPAVDALIEKLKGNPGAVPGPDTKQ
jgi:hypothetical protein